MSDLEARPVGNFFGPFFKIKFYNPNPQPIPKPKNLPEDATGDFAGFFPQATISDLAEEISADNLSKQQEIDSRHIENYAANLVIHSFPGMETMTLTLTPPRQDGLDLLKSGIFQYGGLIGVKFGYEAGNLITKERVFIITQPGVDYGRDITFTIVGIDAFSHVSKLRVSNEMYKREEFRSDRLLLARLANAMSFNLDYFQNFNENKNHPINAIKDDIPIPQAPSDWELFKTVCRSNGIVWHTLPGPNLILYDRQLVTASPISYTFRWYDVPVTDRDIPVSNFKPNPIAAIFAPSSYKSQLNISYDRDTGQTRYEVFSSDKDTNMSHSGDKTDKTVAGTDDFYDQTILTEEGPITLPSYKSALLKEQLQVGSVISSPQNENNALEKARNESRDAARIANFTATITAPGHPDVMPPMNIEVKGSGIFDGPYYVLSAKHSIGTNGYDMTLELLKTVSDTGNSTRVKKPPGQEDPQPTPRGPDDTSSGFFSDAEVP